MTDQELYERVEAVRRLKAAEARLVAEKATCAGLNDVAIVTAARAQAQTNAENARRELELAVDAAKLVAIDVETLASATALLAEVAVDVRVR